MGVMSQRRRVAILGSTGSIGTQTLDVLSRFPDVFEVVRLCAGSNTELLEQQRSVVGLSKEYAQSAIAQPEILTEFSSASDVDIVVNGVVGFAGMRATLAALKANKVLALANKESLIAGGPVVRQITSSPHFRGQIIPVDSEHSAIWQCLRSGSHDEIDELVLTASGGPFRGWNAKQLKDVSKEQALKHPTWSMGPKITIDSATLMNKGLEVIEAHELFNIDFAHINVVVHPQSIVHSMVTFCDGATIAQLSHPDMRLPISLALGVDARLDYSYGKMDFATSTSLEFEPPDREAFPALELAYKAGRHGSGAPAMLSAANEIAVEAFLSEKIPFHGITEVVDSVLQEGIEPVDTEQDVYEADQVARDRAARYVEKRRGQ